MSMYFSLLTLAFAGFFLLVVSYSSSQAQTATAITSDGSLGTVATGRANIHEITGGFRPGKGENLFHSFAQLSVGEGHTADFLNDSGLNTSNILSRVTGGDPSNIFGTIRTTDFPRANFFLLNPAGVVFGPTASLNVGGSFHVTTADYLRFGEQEFFYADLAKDSVLSIASPEAFGFMNESSASILVNGSSLNVQQEQTLSVVGGDIVINGNIDKGEAEQDFENTTANIAAEGGQVNLISVASEGEVSINFQELFSESVLEPMKNLGSVALSKGAFVQTSGNGGGGVVIRGGRLTIDASTISANTRNQEKTSIDTVSGLGIDIQVSEEAILDNGSLLEGNVSTSKNGGDIILKASDKVGIHNGSRVQTVALEGSGNAGDIEISANDVLLSSENISDALTRLRSRTNSLSTGNAGNIRISGNHLEIKQALIEAPTFGPGNSGNINVAVEGNVDFVGSGNPRQLLAISVNNRGEGGSGGNLKVNAKNLKLTDWASLQAATTGSGDAGNINIDLIDNLELAKNSFIQVVSTSTDSETAGSAGNINVTAKDILIAGNINDPSPTTGFTAATLAGKGGNISIKADDLLLTNKGIISNGTRGSSDAGTIDIHLTGNLKMNKGAQIVSITDGSGEAGGIIANADLIEIVGRQPPPFRNRDGSPRPARTVISNLSRGSGKAGDIELTSATNLSVLDGAIIDSQSLGTGDAGSLTMQADHAILLDNATVTTRANNALGGNIKFDAGSLIQVTNSEITSFVQKGNSDAGSINIDPDFIVVQNSEINSSADVGNGGDVRFEASSAILFDSFSTIDASSRFGGNGTIDIQAPIKNLSGTIAPLPEETVPVTALYSARCAAGQGGHFSTFVDSKADSLSPMPGTFLRSPLLSPLAQPMSSASARSQSPVMLTASIAPLVLGQTAEPTTACP